LTQENITDFVNCIKEYAFISIYNKDYSKEAAETCQYLSMLRPELIVPSIICSVFSSIDNITEPYRFTSIMNCLTRITRQLVRYPQGQIYVIPLLMRVLPGIDLNDYEKTSTTLNFLNAIFKVIICVDCSSAVNTRNDLTDMEKEICLSTIKFEDFIIQFLNRIFQMIEILSTDVSNDIPATSEVNLEENTIESKFISILSSIVQQCSDKIFQAIREKFVDFLSCEFLSPKVRKFIGELVRSIAKNKPTETLKYLLPKTCNSIEKIMTSSESNTLLTDDKGDLELTWYLTLFSELVCARGDVLLIYKQMIMSVFHRCISVINKDAYGAIANAANHLLKSLVHVYPMDYRLTNENINEPFINFLPIRVWGQHVDIDKVQVQFHIPNINEVDFACEFVNTFIYPELILLNEKSLILSNNERLRSLTIIYHIAIGCFNMVPFIDSKKVEDL
jgi:proteasome activator subunit 4